jgi:thiol-disulfide isomerase/thioredoxin
VKRSVLSVAALCMCAWLVSLSGLAAEGSKPSAAANLENQLRQSMKIPGDFQFSYHGVDGAAMSGERFVARVMGGDPFDVARDDAHKTVTLKLHDASTDGEVGAVKRLPEFDLARLDGGRARSSELRGRVSLVNFFFETCVPCIKEAPMLSAFRRKHPEYAYLAVTNDPAPEARRFVEQRKLDWPVASDAAPLIAALQIKGYPTYLLVAADGRILGRGSGMDMDAMEKPAVALEKFEQWVTQRLAR